MCRFRCDHGLLALLTLSVGLGCGLEPPEFRFERDLSALQLELMDETVGLFPSQTILEDPSNPFEEDSLPLSESALFDLQSVGSVAAFYGWGTALARGLVDPGLAQFFVAEALENIADDPSSAPNEDPDMLRFMAAEGYRNVMIFFPKSRLFAENPAGDALSLASESARRLRDLSELIGPQRASLPPGWVLVEVPDPDPTDNVEPLDQAVFQVDRQRGGP